MAPLFSVLNDVNPAKTQWALQLRVVRAYDMPSYKSSEESYSFECIFHDREGTRIHATIRRPLISTFKPLLKGGHLYAVKNFVVADNVMKYKTTTHKYKLIFIAKTHVHEFFDDAFPLRMFNFKPFNELLTMDNVEETHLFDIIGTVVARHAPQNREMFGRATKLIDVVIGDIENNRVKCTLWGEYVDQFVTYLDRGADEPVIMILQFCHAKYFGGEVRLSNTYYVTNMILNGGEAEINSFRNKLLESGGNAIAISEISTPSLYPISDDILSGKDVRTIEQIIENKEFGSFWVFATIVDIETKGDWSYVSCKNCRKKVIEVGHRFYCERCDRFDGIGLPRYKLQVRVIDHTGNAQFLLWDQDCVELIGKTALQLRDEATQKKSEYGTNPPTIEALVEKKVLFRVQVKKENVSNQNNVYIVLKISCDPDLITKHFASSLDNQESDIYSKLDKSGCEDEKVFSSNDEVSTPKKTQPRITTSSELLEDSSIKRSLIGEFSSTVPLKKNKVVIKQEGE